MLTCQALIDYRHWMRRRCAWLSSVSLHWGNAPYAGDIPDLTAVFLLAVTVSAFLWLEGDSPIAAAVIVTIVFTPVLIHFLTAFMASGCWRFDRRRQRHRNTLWPVLGLNASPAHLAVGVLCLAMPLWLKRDSQRPCWNILMDCWSSMS